MEIARKLSEAKLEEICKIPKDIVAPIRINPKNYNDAFINNPNGGQDICIEGLKSRNAALEGDLVEVRLNDHKGWRLNYNMIALRWDDWSCQLESIIGAIEDNEKKQKTFKAAIEETAIEHNDEQPSEASNLKQSNGSGETQTSKKTKRSANDKNTSKIPSNLPPGISKLKVEHVINLPFSAHCLQMTGTVTKIVKKNHAGLAGGFLNTFSTEYALFCPTDSRVPRMLIDVKECPLDFVTFPTRYKDVLFVAQLTEWNPTQRNYAKGNLVRIIGESNSIQSRMEAILLEQQIYDTDFPEDAYRELDYLNNLPENWFAENCKGRRDLTNECIFTIDPKTARDLDDAVHVKQTAEQIYEVGVHIADVSHFVKELSAVDYHARLRTTSVYLVDRVIPMLPRVLCEQMCSLNPGEPKLTFSVIWKMDKYGRIIDEWFGRTLIKSCVKLAYEHAQDMIENPDDLSWIKEGSNMPVLHNFDWQHISKTVVLLNKIAQNIRTKRFEGGALKIDQVKIKFELDPEFGHPTGFTFEQRKDANCLIEEYMLLANMAVAKRIYKFTNEMAFLRRHPASSAQLLKEVKEFCDAKGCPMDVSSAGAIQKSINSISDPTMSKVVSFLLLRAMKNAEYICVGSLPNDDSGFRHFALNVPFYTHFTSPIRRYADIIVHRQLSMALGFMDKSNENVESLSQMADECTKRKISSKLISETSQKLYFNLFVQKAGFCELTACVTRIYDLSFDVILVDYNVNGRVYMDKLKDQLENFKFESFSGVKRLVLTWKPIVSDGAEKIKKKRNKAEKRQQVCRTSLETKRAFSSGSELRINQAVNNSQVIEVFDVIKVIVTVDEKDIGKLRIDLKTPNQ